MESSGLLELVLAEVRPFLFCAPDDVGMFVMSVETGCAEVGSGFAEHEHSPERLLSRMHLKSRSLLAFAAQLGLPEWEPVRVCRVCVVAACCAGARASRSSFNIRL